MSVCCVGCNALQFEQTCGQQLCGWTHSRKGGSEAPWQNEAVQAASAGVRILLDARGYEQWLSEGQERMFDWQPSVSIIVPVLNEAKSLRDLCEHLRQLDPEPDEVIFVDGGIGGSVRTLLLHVPLGPCA